MNDCVESKQRKISQSSYSLLFLAMMLFMVFSISTCFANSSNKSQILTNLGFQKTSQVKNHLRILTVYYSASGFLKQKAGNMYQAQLSDSEENVTYFSDLPDRQEGRMNAKKFFRLCQQRTGCSLQNNGELIYQADYQKARIELPISIKSVRWISDIKDRDYLGVDFSLLSKTETFRAGEMKDVVFLIYQHCY